MQKDNVSSKYIDESWDFRTADTKIYTHCFHIYPAMMIPQIARRIIENYGVKAKLLFDPYCGTGTSLVEANLKDINAIGTDLNPLARLIATTKTTLLNIEELDLILNDFENLKFMNDPINITPIDIPSIKNIDFWFSKDVREELTSIKFFIDKIKDKNIANFFKVAFSETTRETSWTRNSEFKLYKMTEKQIEKFKPNSFELMYKKLLRNRKGLVDFINIKKNGSFTKVYSFNTINNIPKEILEEESVDLIITSPPYGDSRTTVAYGQFSRFANEWLNYENAAKVDGTLMGSNKNKEIIDFDSSKLLNIKIKAINGKDKKRALEVYNFYKDYEKSIGNISKVVKKGGIVCYVVGNRKVKGEVLPTDEITKDMFEVNNFKHIETIIRNIPNKRMPLKNSPTNITGELDTTMCNEFIVIMKKN